MSSRKHRFPVRAAVWGAALTALLLAGVEATADDRDLLRFDSGKPYVFILLDTSGSMTLAPDGSWLPGSGDDPGSRIFQAKKALYEVFRSVGDVNIGFATFNQDRLRVRAKHWLYEVEPPSTGGRLSLAGGEYPSTGELMTLGAHFAIGTPGVAGNCANPLPFATQRDRINRFAKLGVDGLRQTTIWLSDAGKTYRLTVGPDAGEALGSSTLSALFTLDAVPDCASPPPPPAPGAAVTGAQARVRMSLVQEFLMRDLETTAGSVEPSGGFWPWEDAFGAASCTDGTPFSGRGWEGNYDSSLDRWCDPANPLTCRNLKHTTVTSPIAPELDLGDVIPLNWDVTNIDEMLDRLAPDRALGTETFAAAPFFTDQPVGPGLALKQSGQRPIVAAGSDSPLGKAIADFRCWYLGQGAPKCRSFGAPTGWENVAAEEDTEWGCRQPYLIVVGDGGDSCQGENPCADTANLFAQAGVRSWVITYGGANRPPLSCIAQNGRGELIFVSDGDNLQDELRRILGEIRQETATFASAAAPSTQRVVDRTIYVSTFTPISGSSRWDGHLDSFLKPLPLTTAGQPNRDSDQHQWDAGEELVAQAPTLATAVGGDLDLGRGEDERRIFYARERTSTGRVQPGGWPLARRAFDWTEDSTPAYIRYDLWEGLRIPFTADDPAPPPGLSGVDQTAQNSANLVLSKTVATRSATVEGEPVTFVLGDIFHSDPVVLGSPANTRLFAEDAESDGRTCEAGNRGYRCFFRKHQFRRKQLLVGSNDGMLHAFDAGLPEVVTDPLGNEDIRFNEGTGREIFAYVPRAVLPNVRRLTESSTHRFTVDGPPVAADVFIDPLGAANPDEREFRTVVITGLREGGASYFALDVTQPDEIGEEDGLPDPLAGADSYVPSCVAENNTLGPTPPSDCGPVPYPSPLWEFNDTVFDEESGRYVFLDENGDGSQDLGDTWSQVAVGRVRVCEGAECDPDVPDNDVRDLWVAIFGGGMDPGRKNWDPREEPDAGAPPVAMRGDWLYMVDIETGRTVYKRQLLVEIDDEHRSAGPAPGGAAAVDTDQDGYLDRVYLGTVGGYLFRVDLHLESDGDAHSLVDHTVQSTKVDDDGNPVTFTVRRFPLTSGGQPVWEPRAIFTTNFDGGSATTLPRPIYHEPAVIFAAELGRYALAFGTGDREDLWSGNTQSGRFYVFVDETDLLLDSALPQTENDFVGLAANSPDIGPNLLTSRGVGQRGWYLILDDEERVISDAFSLAGVTFFSSYQPDVLVTSGQNPLCSKTGGSRIFIVNTTNGNSFVEVAGVRSRFLLASSFVTQPYTEQGGNANPPTGSGNEPPTPTADDLTDQLRQVMEEMKSLFPPECKFANYRIDIKTLKADTGVVFIAPVPVCLIEKNWREF